MIGRSGTDAVPSCRKVWYCVVPMSRERRTTTVYRARISANAARTKSPRASASSTRRSRPSRRAATPPPARSKLQRARGFRSESYTRWSATSRECSLRASRGARGGCRCPPTCPRRTTARTLADLLASFGTHLVREVTDPAVVAVFRLAIAEAVHAPEVAHALDSIGRDAARAAWRKIMAAGQGVRTTRRQPPGTCRSKFAALLWGDLMISLLLGVISQPNPRRDRQARPRRRGRVPATSSAAESVSAV